MPPDTYFHTFEHSSFALRHHNFSAFAQFFPFVNSSFQFLLTYIMSPSPLPTLITIPRTSEIDSVTLYTIHLVFADSSETERAVRYSTLRDLHLQVCLLLLHYLSILTSFGYSYQRYTHQDYQVFLVKLYAMEAL